MNEINTACDVTVHDPDILTYDRGGVAGASWADEDRLLDIIIGERRAVRGQWAPPVPQVRSPYAESEARCDWWEMTDAEFEAKHGPFDDLRHRPGCHLVHTWDGGVRVECLPGCTCRGGR